jgi:RNA polymerase sigma factor (sigma-70 family)
MGPIPVDPESLERIEALVDLAPIRQAVREAMATLPKKTREAVYLRVGLDLPYKEVASRLGCSEGATRTRVTRGLSRLAVIIEEHP